MDLDKGLGEMQASYVGKDQGSFVRQWGLWPFLRPLILISRNSPQELGRRRVQGDWDKHTNQIELVLSTEACTICWKLREDGVEEGILLQSTPARGGGRLSCLVFERLACRTRGY